MIVDLYTDASIVAGKGAWAVVIVREGHPLVEHSGRLRGSFRSSSATEIAAICNGLFHARTVRAIGPGDRVRVWCDNTAAVMWANGECRVKRDSDPQLDQCRRYIRNLVQRAKITCHARHIKGHQRLDSRDPQAIYNMRADELCSAIRDNVEPKPFEVLQGRIALAHARREKREAKAA